LIPGAAAINGAHEIGSLCASLLLAADERASKSIELRRTKFEFVPQRHFCAPPPARDSRRALKFAQPRFYAPEIAKTIGMVAAETEPFPLCGLALGARSP
jgi:hypothetical protein